jgi:predicted transcriptional regulator
MSKSPPGELERDILRFIATQQPVTVGEVAEGFGVPRALARTTVQTVMERLRKKGVLVREAQNGLFRYRAQAAPENVLRGLVRDFVERSLAGSVSPFVAYLSETRSISNAEFEQLQQLVARLETQRKEEQP